MGAMFNYVCVRTDECDMVYLHLTSMSTNAGSLRPREFLATHLYVPALCLVTGDICMSFSTLNMPLFPPSLYHKIVG